MTDSSAGFPTPAPTEQSPPSSTLVAPTVDVLGVKLHNLSRDELLEKLDHGVFFNPNVDVIMKLRKDPQLLGLFAQAEFCVCDSRIVELAAKFLGTSLKGRVPGSSFFGEFCAYHRDHPDIRVFMLGAGPGVADEARRRVNLRIGREVITGAHSPSFGFEKNEAESRAIVDTVNASGATVLAVGVGCPKQERWIMQWKLQMPGIRIFMAVGATIDFEAGNVVRAPHWMNAAGLEWLFRLWREPKRLWRRYLIDDLPFLWLVLKQKLGLSTAIRS